MATRIFLAILAVLLNGAMAAAGATPEARHPTPRPRATAAPVTDDTVAARVASAQTRADHEALAAYYKKKAAAEAPRIEHFDQLFRAYMKLKGKEAEALQRHARTLLKAARMSQQQYSLLAQAHLNIAWKD